ncbi:MAG TPA: hypothetical protein DCM04_07510 [Saprospirales bacterium]|nr:hypothetical protein [Saprospirales bacterium]
MKNRIFNTLILFVFGLSILQAQSITAEFDETEIAVGGTAVLTVTANPPAVDQEPGEFQILIDFPQTGNYIDSDGVEPVAVSSAPEMTWITIAESGGSDTWLGTNVNTVLATIGGGSWTLTVEGVNDTGGLQDLTVSELYYNGGDQVVDDAELIVNASLPVEFSYVNARNQDCESVDVIWQTQSEINNRGFFIERSVGSVDRFEDMGFVESKGDSNKDQTYTFEDDINDLSGNTNLYYRIKQVDIDGRVSFSEMVVIRLDCEDQSVRFNVRPNPAFNDLYVDVDGSLDVASKIVVLNSLSQTIATLPINKTGSRTLVDVTKYIAGMYYIRILNNNNEVIFTEKIIVTK